MRNKKFMVEWLGQKVIHDVIHDCICYAYGTTFLFVVSFVPGVNLRSIAGGMSVMLLSVLLFFIRLGNKSDRKKMKVLEERKAKRNEEE